MLTEGNNLQAAGLNIKEVQEDGNLSLHTVQTTVDTPGNTSEVETVPEKANSEL